MRMFTISPAIIDAMRHASLTAQPERAAQIPLYLPAFDGYELASRTEPDFTEYDAEDARVEAGGLTIGGADDDFY